MNCDGVMSNCGVMHIPDVMWNVTEMQNVCECYIMQDVE